jgi:hypothetical protein
MLLMLVGIGFVAILTGAIAERFVAGQVSEHAAEIEEELAGDLEDTREAALRELRAISNRMQKLEATVERLGR